MGKDRKDKAMRATLEDCIDNQEALRLIIDELIRDNRYITDGDERKEILRLLAKSCLGLDYKTPFSTIIDDRKLAWPHLGYAVRRVSYWNDNYKDSELDGLEPREVWKAILRHLFIVFSPALDKATSVSKEIIQYKKDVPRGYE